MDGRLPTDLLLDLLAQKFELLGQLQQLSVRQQQLIAAADMDRLTRLLAARQTLVGHLQQLQRQLEPFRHQDPDARQWRTTFERERGRQLAAGCESRLSEILALEKRSEAEMSRHRVQASIDVPEFTRAIATAAYGQALPVAGGSIDLSSEG